MYVLVLLTERPNAVGPVPDHEPFIDSLIERELVMLGGPAEGGEAAAAYVLRCDSLAEAHEVVAADPLVSSGAMTASVSRWDLVGIDPRLIDRDLVVGEEGP